jgi:transcriptional regulator with XRE-family HTH domain
MPRCDEPISRVLRQAIAESGLSFKRLEKETGVLRQSVMRFARGEQSLRGDKMDRLAVFFGLELRATRKRR